MIFEAATFPIFEIKFNGTSECFETWNSGSRKFR